MLKKYFIIWLLIIWIFGFLWFQYSYSLTQKNMENTNQIMQESVDVSDTQVYKNIVLAWGCFWCIEWAFDEYQGVIEAVSWYTWWSEQTANYKDVSSGATQHREVVQVTYNPDLISLDEILDRFFQYIDPFDEWGQFADRWYQYTTAIYYQDQQELDFINKYIEEKFDKKIATKVVEKSQFYEAEEYHQDYAKKSAFRYNLYFKWSWRQDYVNNNK